MIAEYGFGGFVLFKNMPRAAASGRALPLALGQRRNAAPLSPSIKKAAARTAAGTFHALPAADKIGRASNPELAYRAGRAVADELLLAGVNLNFAPVLTSIPIPAIRLSGTRFCRRSGDRDADQRKMA